MTCCPAISSYKNTEVVDFSFNPLADPKFSFYDHSLVEAVKLGIPEVQGFFRLLALCHTVMAEEKSKGTFEKIRSSLLTKPKTEFNVQRSNNTHGALFEQSETQVRSVKRK